MTSPQFMLSDLATQIKAAINASFAGTGAQLVDGYISENTDIDRQRDGSVVPTAILTMGDPGEYARGAAITGVLDSMEYVTFFLLLIAPSQDQLRVLHDLARKALRGIVFPRCGEIRQVPGVGGTGGRPVPTLYAPARHAKTVGFTMSIGA